MKLKPPALLRKRKLRNLIAVGVAFAGLSSIALAQTTPAMADPTETLVAVGSDTIQDVWNQFATHLGGNFVGSYNATNPTTNTTGEDITPADGTASVNCAFVRPNGSGAGIAALKYSLGDHSTAVVNALTPALNTSHVDLPGAGCVDIARSSSNPGSNGNYAGTDAIQYIPFALDAVTGATGPATSQSGDTFTVNGTTVSPVATTITDADEFTVANLTTLYHDCQPVTLPDGTTYWPKNGVAAQPAGSKVIDLYVPQAGSGTRNFWGQQLGNFPTGAGALPQCVFDTIQGGPVTGVAVEEHDGTAVSTDPNGYGPFSIAQWISQRGGHNDRRHDAVIHSLATDTLNPPTEVSPFSNGNPATGTLNTSFPITRQVFNVVSQARILNANDPLHSLLVGSTSQVCNDKSDILSYGFALIGSSCGQVIQANAVKI